MRVDCINLEMKISDQTSKIEKMNYRNKNFKMINKKLNKLKMNMKY